MSAENKMQLFQLQNQIQKYKSNIFWKRCPETILLLTLIFYVTDLLLVSH